VRLLDCFIEELPDINLDLGGARVVQIQNAELAILDMAQDAVLIDPGFSIGDGGD
jgi:hypothetical protein